MPDVIVPKVGRVRFPDSMAPADIQAALVKLTRPPGPEQPSRPGYEVNVPESGEVAQPQQPAPRKSTGFDANGHREPIRLPAPLAALASMGEQAGAGAVETVMPSVAGLRQSGQSVRQMVASLRSLGGAARAQGFETAKPVEPTPAPEQPRDWTGAPPPSNMAEKIARGVGSGLGYAGETIGLTALGVPEAAAVVAPAMTGAGTVEQRIARGVTMGAGGEILKAAEPFGEALASKLPAAIQPTARVIGHAVAPAAVYSSVVPYAEVGLTKALGVENVDWPKVGDSVPSFVALSLIGAAGAGARAKEDRSIAALPPERVAAWKAITAALKEPPGNYPEPLRQANRSASQALLNALHGQELTLDLGAEKPSKVTVINARVYDYPDVGKKVRLVVEDAASGKVVPLVFDDLAAMRKAISAPEEPAAGPIEAAQTPEATPAAESPVRGEEEGAGAAKTSATEPEPRHVVTASGFPDEAAARSGAEHLEKTIQDAIGPARVRQVEGGGWVAEIDRPERRRVPRPPLEPGDFAGPPEPPAEPTVDQIETHAQGLAAQHGRMKGVKAEKYETRLRELAADPGNTAEERAAAHRALVLIDQARAAERPAFEADVFHGSGRKDIAAGYGEGTLKEPILGPGRYTAFNEELARHFGPNVRKLHVELRNPLVVDSDAQWKKLARDAGWEFPNPTRFTPGSEAVTRREIAAMRKMLEARGYDGVVVRLAHGSRMDDTKTLSNVFGDDQVIEFHPPMTAAPGPEGAARGGAPAVPEPEGKGAALEQGRLFESRAPGARRDFEVRVRNKYKIAGEGEGEPMVIRAVSRGDAVRKARQRLAQEGGAGNFVLTAREVPSQEESRVPTGPRTAPEIEARIIEIEGEIAALEHGGDAGRSTGKKRVLAHDRAEHARLEDERQELEAELARGGVVQSRMPSLANPPKLKSETVERREALTNIGRSGKIGKFTAAAVPTEAELKGLPEASVPGAGLRKDWTGAFVQKGISAVRGAVDEIIAITNPNALVARGDKDIFARNVGKREQVLARVEQQQAKVAEMWDKRSKPQLLEFWNRLEHGAAQDPRLAEMDRMYRERMDNLWLTITRYKDVPYWENYFPHIFKNEAQARDFISQRIAPRPFEGTKRYLKGRVLPDIAAALEAGLEPVDWNPERLVQAMEADVSKLALVNDSVKDCKAAGSGKYLPIGKPMPEDFEAPKGRWATQYLPPEIPVTEYHDAAIMQGLSDLAARLGIPTERKVNIGGVGRLGYAEKGSGRVVTKFATPEDVLAHEIGHQIDAKYDMQSFFFRKKEPLMKQEMRALADLRWEGQPASPTFKQYVRSNAEKMAVMFQAYMHAPERFKEVAPHVYERFVEFASLHPDVKPILDIKPSLTYAAMEGKVSAGGMVIGGRWAFQRDLTRILDNHLSEDWIRSSKLGRGAMMARNTLTAIELSLSGFHAVVLTGVTTSTKLSVGASMLYEAATGRKGSLAETGMLAVRGAFNVLRTPIAPLEYAATGWLLKHYDPRFESFQRMIGPGMSGAEGMTRAFQGGAKYRPSVDPYRQDALSAFQLNMRRIQGAAPLPEKIGPALKLPFQGAVAAIQLPIRIIQGANELMKIGAFYDTMSWELERRADDLKAGKTTKAEIARQMWTNVEDRQGLVNYDSYNWNRTLKAALLVCTRAPGWAIGTVKAGFAPLVIDLPRAAAAGLRAERPDITQRMWFVLSSVFTTLAMGALFWRLHRDDKPETLEDLMHPKDSQGNRHDIPGYAMEWTRWVNNPFKEAQGKIASALEVPIELLQNQDHRGPIHQPLNSIDDWYPAAAQTLRWLYHTRQPFAIQQHVETAEKGGGTKEKVDAALGIRYHVEPKPSRRRFHERRY